MAKKKKRKSLLPKRIAGVKVPKSVRKGRLGELLASRTGQALLAEAVMAAGAVGVAKQTKDSAKGAFSEGLTDALRHWDGKHKGRDGVIALALAEAARAFVGAVNQHRAEPRADADGAPKAGSAEPPERPAAHWANETVEERGSKKKPISYKAGPL